MANVKGTCLLKPGICQPVAVACLVSRDWLCLQDECTCVFATKAINN